MDLDKPITTKRSLGALRRAKKTKPKSPDLTGTLTLQRHTASAIAKILNESRLDEVVCNLAAWRNQDAKGNPYLTIELSPRYVPRESTQNSSGNLDFIFEDQEEDE